MVQRQAIRCLLDLDRPARLGARLDLGHGDAEDAVSVLGRHCILADGRRKLDAAAKRPVEALAEPGRGLVLEGGLGDGGIGRLVGGRLGGASVVLLAGERKRAAGVVDR